MRSTPTRRGFGLLLQATCAPSLSVIMLAGRGKACVCPRPRASATSGMNSHNRVAGSPLASSTAEERVSAEQTLYMTLCIKNVPLGLLTGLDADDLH